MATVSNATVATDDAVAAAEVSATSLCASLRSLDPYSVQNFVQLASPLIDELQNGMLQPIPSSSASHERYRVTAVRCGVSDIVVSFLVAATRSKDQRCACRALRGLAGSPVDASANAIAVAAVTPSCVAAIIAICEKYIACAPHDGDGAPSQLEVLEQAIGALMNTLRPPEASSLRRIAIDAGVVPCLASVLSFALNLRLEDASIRVALFSCYALLALARDPTNHHAFGGTAIAAVKRAAAAEPLALRATGIMILAPLSASFDDPSDSISLDVPAVQFIADTLARRLDPTVTEYIGWKVPELVHALFSISATDTLKSLLVDVNAVPLLLQVLETAEHEGSWTSAVSAIANLTMHSDDEQCRRSMTAIASPVILSRLEALMRSSSPDVAKQASAIVAAVAMHDSSPVAAPSGAATLPLLLRSRSSDGSAARARRGTAEAGDPLLLPAGGDDGDFDVMISYNWGSKRTVLRMRDALVAMGVRVWLDEEHMGSDLMDSMASAVETSKCVIICCSSAYKTSPNCRREATYAAHMNKPMIIANMEHKYVARGWLGLHIAGKIWADFRDEDEACFRRGMATLVKQLVECSLFDSMALAAALEGS